MSVLSWIIAMSLLGGALSVSAAALIAVTARATWIPVLISYAIGALLGAAFLEVLPHAFESAASHEQGAATLLAGILLFFILEKLVLWRHCHQEGCEGHEPAPAHGHEGHEGHDHHGHHGGHGNEQHGHSDHGRSGLLILVGDTFHNFVDGVLIAAAFLQSVQLGVVTALAIIAHEIPQEVGDFVILLHSGYSKARALAFNLLSTLATVVGGVLAYFGLSAMQQAVPVFLGLAAASMIYVAVADLIPGLHKRPELAATVQQVALIGLGIGTIALAHRLVDQFFG